MLFKPYMDDWRMYSSDLDLNSSELTGVPGAQSGLRTTYSTHTAL